MPFFIRKTHFRIPKKFKVEDTKVAAIKAIKLPNFSVKMFLLNTAPNVKVLSANETVYNAMYCIRRIKLICDLKVKIPLNTKPDIAPAAKLTIFELSGSIPIPKKRKK